VVDGFTVGRAGADELDVVLDILRSASDGRVPPGAARWGREFPDIVRDLPAGAVYLGRLRGRPVGTFVLRWMDESVWELGDGAAGYVHRLATRPEVGGQGLGAALLDVAAGLVRERGRDWLRLDCDRGNAPLRAYYEAQGFVYAGDGKVRRVSRAGYRAASLYQRRVSGAGVAPSRCPA
jgi:GNAT superfamily N-acetyltransferase